MAQDVFSSNGPTTTVSSGGTTAPAALTSESWTVASSTGFPAAATGISQFRIADRAHPAEIMIVTNVSGTAWTVTRGAEGTTPVAHTAGFTVYQALTAGVLAGFGPLAASGDTTGTKDTAAITAAISAASSGGGLAQLGAGTFWVNAGLTVPAGVTVAGMGQSLTTVKIAASASGFNVFTAASVSNAGWRDMTIDLNKSGTTNGASSALQMGISISANSATVTGVSVRRVTVQNGWQQGISLSCGGVMANTVTAVLDDVTVTSVGDIGIFLFGGLNCRMARTAAVSCGQVNVRSGIQVQASSGVQIDSPKCTGNSANGIVFNFGSYSTPCSNFQVTGGDCSSNNASGSSGYGIVVSEGCYDFAITGVRCETNGAGGIGVDTAWDATRVSGTATSGTTTTLTDSSVTPSWPVNSWAGWTVRFTSGTGSGQSAVITSNTATALTFGAVTTAPDATTHYAIDGSHIFTPVAATISGCVCANNTHQGIWVDYCSNLTITGCEVHHNGGIGVDLTAQYCLVTGNDIHDNTGRGVLLNQGSDPMGGHRVTGNAYQNNQSGKNVAIAATTYPNIVDEYVNLGQASTLITATNTTWPIPNGANWLEITCVGDGGQGGGAGSAAVAQLQAGGGAGAAGASSTQVVAVGSNTTLNVTIGAGGSAAGGGGAAGGNGGSGGICRVSHECDGNRDIRQRRPRHGRRRIRGLVHHRGRRRHFRHIQPEHQRRQRGQRRVRRRCGRKCERILLRRRRWRSGRDGDNRRRGRWGRDCYRGRCSRNRRKRVRCGR